MSTFIRKYRLTERIVVHPGFLVLLGGIFYFGKPSLAAIYLLAALFHELGHILMARMLGLSVCRLNLSAVGAQLQLCQNGSYLQDILLCLSGPGLNMLLTNSKFPLFSGANLLLGLFNLLPIRGLDGGNALYALLALCIGPVWAEVLLRWISRLFAFAVILAGLFVATLPEGNPRLMMLGAWLFVCAMK